MCNIYYKDKDKDKDNLICHRYQLYIQDVYIILI